MLRKLKSRRRISIATRLYFVVGLMGLLILVELFTLQFAMQKLSAVRAFVGGESLWSKAQKNAVFSLQRFATTKSERDYQMFLDYLSIPLGDREARMALEGITPDLEKARAGFLKGNIHPDDISPIINLLTDFYWVEEIAKSVTVWKAADEKIEELISAGKEFHAAVIHGQTKTAESIMEHVKNLNEELTVLEEDFSRTLAAGSRLLEKAVLILLSIAVLTVGLVSLSLTFFTARSISKGLGDLSHAANEIGHGRLDARVIPRSNDEISELADGLNRMGEMLKKSYGELEARVKERTEELAKLAEENARLYTEASLALKKRDEFLSLASHELKTPITSLLLQAQLLLRTSSGSQAESTAKQMKLAVFLERQLLRINELVEEMLDTSRIDLQKLSLKFEPHDLSGLVRDICERFKPQFAETGNRLSLEIEDAVKATFDSYRIEQVLTNLLTNAMKYAPGSEVRVSLRRCGAEVEISVHDHGPGVPAEDARRIFGRFERGVNPGLVSGLGIGLFISHAIVSAHRGRIQVDPSATTGARFVVNFPMEPHAASAMEAPEITRPAGLPAV